MKIRSMQLIGGALALFMPSSRWSPEPAPVALNQVAQNQVARLPGSASMQQNTYEWNAPASPPGSEKN
jgi:hypothetical protein